ncbi:MAG: choice-of-anchor J domain-containing protein [Bacteroidales bacterium]|nr:choice-of-anchor J domain-containing protein [Bacteroidales bacterium]
MKNFSIMHFATIILALLIYPGVLRAQINKDHAPQAAQTLQQHSGDPVRAAERLKILLKWQMDKEKELLLSQTKADSENPVNNEMNSETASLSDEEKIALLAGYGITGETIEAAGLNSDDINFLVGYFAGQENVAGFDDDFLPAYKDWLSEQDPTSVLKPNVYKTSTITSKGNIKTLYFDEFKAPSWIYSADSVVLGANLNEGFESGTIPDNWTIINADGGTHFWEPSTVNPHGGAYSARVHWETTTLDNDDWLITPPLSVSADSVNEISFWMRTYNGTYEDPWEVLVSTTDNDPSSFTMIDNGLGPIGDYVQKTYSLDSYGDAIVYVAVRYIGSYDWYLYVDDFTGPPVVYPSCPEPKELTATNLTTSSADLGWTPQGLESTWNIVWGDPGFDPSTEGTLISDVTTNPYTLNGLNILTSYEFYVQAICGEGDTSQWAGPLLFQTTSNPLSGNYTINSTIPTGGTNFNSFTDFASAANLGGLAGPVTIEVVSGTGPYNEQVLLGELPNSSATNTISLFGNGETLAFLSTDTDLRATLTLDGTDYITIDSLNIIALGENTGEYGWAVWLANNADFNTFTACTFTATMNATGTGFAAFVTSNSSTGATTAGLAASHLTVDNCVASGGYYCMVINGPSNAPYSESNIITNNEIRDFYYYGLYIRGNNNSLFSENLIHRPDRPSVTTAYMVYLTSNMNGSVVTKNRITKFAGSSSTTSTAYGIYGTTLSADLNSDLLITNNVISGFDNMDGINYGMYFSTSIDAGYLKIYHNSVSVDNIDHPDTDIIRGFYHTGTNANLELINNIFAVTSNSSGIKYCMYLASNTASVVSDHNDLFMGAVAGTNHIGYWDATSYTTLTDWQAANGGIFDQNSLDVDPLFSSPSTGNLSPGNPLIDNIGMDLTAIVPDDINGVIRSNTPDPGAYEFDVTGCIQPSNLMADNILGSQADLFWTDNNSPSASMWDIELGPAGFTPTGIPTASNVTNNPYTYTGLSPNSDYDWYVRAVCGADDTSSWVGPGTFTTACASFTAPFTEHFQNTTIPNCWSTFGPDEWLFTTDWPDYGALDLEDHTGTGGSFAGVDGSAPVNVTGVTLESPAIDVTPLIEPQLRFYLFNNNINDDDYQTLRVDLWNGTTWNEGIFFWGPTDNDPSWVEVQTVLSPYNITGDIKLRFVVDKSTGNSWYDDLIIDDVYIEEAPDCPNPVGLNAQNITSTSADLMWSSISGLSDIEFGLAGFTPTGVPTYAEVMSPYPLTNLAPSTSYAYYVRDICGVGEFSNWVGPYIFTTECATFTAPFIENFQDITLPNCWTISGPQDWLFTNTWPDYGAADIEDHTGTGGSFAGVDGSGTAGLTDITLESPFIDVSTLAVPQLRFFLFNNNIDNDDWQSLDVDFWDGSTWNTSIFTWGSGDNSPEWVEVEVVLSTFTITGDVKFRFIVDKSSGFPYYDDLVIDDVFVEEAPACPKPTNLGVQNITATSADLLWSSLSGLSDIEFGIAGFTPTGVPTDPNVVSPFAKTDLTSATSYTFYVRDVCTGGDYSNWNGPFTFSTPCEVFDIPFEESFDDINWPLCWTQTYEGGVTSERWSVASTNLAGGVPNEMTADWINVTGVSRLILPPLNLTGTVPSLRFTHFYDAYGTVQTLTHKVQTSSDGVNWTDENFSFVSGGTNIGPEEVEINLNNNIGPNTYIAFVMDGNHFQFDAWNIDNVEVFQNLYGTLAGTVTELATGDPIEGALITIGPYSGVSTADGTYSVNALVGSYTAGCSATGYNPQSGIDVVIEDSQTTSLNFEMTAPDFNVNMSSVSVVINPNQQLDEVLNIENTGNGPGSWNGGLIEIEKSTDDLFDLQFDWPTQGSSGETAVATDGDYIYTSTWNSSNFHKYNMDGTYVGSFTCGVAGGIRDLTYDGTYFYGAAANASIFEMDLANGTVISTFSAPTQVRAIAYDEAQDVFYANNTSTDIVKFNKSGANLGSFPVGPNGTDYYGFAVDNYSPGAPYLWGYSRTGNSMNQLIQIQLPDGTETGVTFDLGSVISTNDGMAGGLVITKDIVAGLQVLTGIVLGERVWGLELTEAGPDWLVLSPIGGTLSPGENEDFTLSFDATDLTAGVYEAELHLSFNPNVGTQVIPVTMTIDETIIAPVNLSVSYDCTDIELTWEMPAGATPDSWNIYRDGAFISNIAGMTYSESMLDPGVEYCFEVTALYGGMESSPAGPECITIPVPENLAPTDLEGIANSPDGNNITLNWTAPTGCLTPDGYNVYRDSVMINTEMLTDLSYVDTLYATGTYLYAVSAVYYFDEMWSDTSSVYIVIVGMGENYAGELLIFPNPASHYVRIQSDTELAKVILFDNTGREIQTDMPADLRYRLDVANLERGIYYLRIETRKGHTIRKITLN